jgi:hypothetical protein
MAAKVSAAASETGSTQTDLSQRKILQNQMPINTQIYAAGLFRRWTILQSPFIIDKKSVMGKA